MPCSTSTIDRVSPSSDSIWNSGSSSPSNVVVSGSYGSTRGGYVKTSDESLSEVKTM